MKTRYNMKKRKSNAKKRKNRRNIHLRMQNKSFRHELRKRRKDKNQPAFFEDKFGDVVASPHIQAMFATAVTRRKR